MIIAQVPSDRETKAGAIQNSAIHMEIAVYWGLFIVAFGAATILPLQSEWAVVGLLIDGNYPWEVVVIVASLGNILGSTVNWLLGRSFVQLQDKSWFPASGKNLARATDWYHRYGRLSLLLSGFRSLVTR